MIVPAVVEARSTFDLHVQIATNTSYSSDQYVIGFPCEPGPDRHEVDDLGDAFFGGEVSDQDIGFWQVVLRRAHVVDSRMN